MRSSVASRSPNAGRTRSRSDFASCSVSCPARARSPLQTLDGPAYSVACAVMHGNVYFYNIIPNDSFAPHSL